MMSISIVNPELREEEVKPKDEFVDRQYVKPTSSDEQYEEAPWEHCRDPIIAYLGLRIQDREEFLSRLEEEKQHRIAHELERIKLTRKQFSSHDHKKSLMEKLENAKKEWKNEVTRNVSNFQRGVQSIQKTLQEDPGEVVKKHPVFKRELNEKRRDLLERRRDVESEFPTVQRDLERLWAGWLQLKYQRHSMLIRRLASWGTNQQTQSQPTPVISEGPQSSNVAGGVKLEPTYGLRVSAMYFKKAKGKDIWLGYTHYHKRYTGEFPNQRISMDEILNQDDDNPLMQLCPPDTIRYFHFPTNNMSLIETAIARYYNEMPLTIDGRMPDDPKARKTEKLLAREFWRGQMHGTGGASAGRGRAREDRTSPAQTEQDWARRGGPVHARHMRPRCFIIPRGRLSSFDLFVFFLRRNADPVQGDQSSDSDSPSSPAKPSHLMNKGLFPLQLPPKDKNIALFLPYLHWETSSRRAKMAQVINEAMGYEVKSPSISNIVIEAEKKHLKSGGNPKRQTPRKHKTLLGEYLRTVAKVADEMDYEADERLLRDHVKADPPLHIRRTLDQYYSPTLDDTLQRDKDQVVYRGTKAGRSLHSRNTRVVMVDQLWLWILDDNTIITSFPRRWGRNQLDSSDVHKSLREHLETGRDEIKSIYHLALIIIDQCSHVFFDQTKPLDERPEVMDMFASAIGHVREMTSMAYLNINAEGVLLKEAQGIAEELRIMNKVYTEQLNVVKDFKKHLCHLTGKDTTQGDIAVLKKLLLDIAKNQIAGNDEIVPSDDEGARSKQKVLEVTLHEAEGTLELIKSRQAEIQDLEDSAVRICQQLQDFLYLKQQEASVVNANAALQRADESVRQGRTIMAFTIVTIFFLPLGFFAAFFGMNNAEINGATWMSLNEQITYMFGLSAVIIIISISIAFSAWIRAIIQIILRIPYHVLDEYTQFRNRWAASPLNHVTLEQKTNSWLQHRKNRRLMEQKEKEKKDAEDSPKAAGAAGLPNGSDKAGSAARWLNGSALRRERGRAQGGLV
ncbi:hypothetical protein DL769_003560 [Monosporascus sp. CRB-8-3]|nr:hypothetical protein DL769_003560 [Monosporascus sp. CRB-8-3]